MRTVPAAKTPMLVATLIEALQSRSLNDPFGASVERWSGGGNQSVEARVLRSLQDEEFDPHLIREADLL